MKAVSAPALAFLLFAFCPCATSLVAQTTLYWDGDGTGAVAGGTGTWDTTLARWSTTSNGSTYQGWTNGTNTASFSGTGYTVTLGADITAGQLATASAIALQFNGHDLTLGGDNASSSVQNLYFFGNGNFIKTGTGAITLSSLDDHAGNTEIQAGSLIASAAAGLGRGTLVLNGGTLKFSTSFDLGSHAITVASTSIIDTNGFNTNSTAAIGGNGSLIKAGTGTLTLAGNSTYTGNTTINAGSLSVAAKLYNTGTTAGNIIVNSGGMLELDAQDVFGVHTTNPAVRVTINAGGLVTNGNFYNTFTNLALNGGELRAAGGGSATFPAYQLKGTVTVGGASASLISTTGASNSQIHLGDNTAGGVTTFDVANVNGSNATDLTISAVLQDGRNASATSVATGLTKTGAGTLTLAGSNTYTGPTTISAGTIEIGNGGTSGSVAGNITNNAALVFNRSDAMIYAGTISGAGSLTKAGAGFVTLSAAASYTGNTAVSAGTLALASATASPAFAIASGATLELNVASDRDASTNTVTFSGTGTLRKTGAGSVYWGGNTAVFAFSAGSLIDVQAGNFQASSFANENWTNNYSGLNVASGASFTGAEGNVRVDALTGSGLITSGYTGAGYTNFTFGVANGSGTFSGVLTDDQFGHVGNYVKAGTGTQTLTGNNTFSGSLTITGGLINFATSANLGSGTIMLNGGGLQWATGSTADISPRLAAFGSSGATLDTNGNNVTLASALAGTGSLNKTGAGVLTLSGTNTYAGGTTISGGTLRLGSTSAVPATSAVTVNTGATFDAGNVSSTVGSLSGAGNVTLGSATLNAGSDNTSTTFPGVISGTGGLTKSGTGTLTLAGVNTYAGSTTITGGRLVLGTGGAVPANSPVVIGAAATLDLANISTTFNSISGAGSIALGSATLTTGGGNSSDTISGAIYGIGGLTKTGTGMLTLSGNNTFTGTTTVSAGTLNAVTSAGTFLQAANNTTLQLGGWTLSGEPGSAGGTASDGGAGASPTSFGAGVSLNTSASLSGGAGGTGGPGFTSPFFTSAGNGGAGADAVNMGAHANVNNSGNLSGGRGGNVGSNGSLLGVSGNGGNGLVVGASSTVTNSGTLAGGSGGDSASFRGGGPGGSGVVLGDGSSLFNSGTIQAGTDGRSNVDGGSGVAVSGQNLTIVNSGTLTGGSSGVAVSLGGTSNTFELRAGSSISGQVVAGGTNDTLVLGGNTDGSVVLSSQYTGFESLTKNGTSTWTVTGSLPASLTITAGTLKFGAANSLSSTPAVIIGAGGTFDLGGYAVTMGSISGSGSVSLGSGTLSTGGDNTTTTYSGVMSGLGGSFTKSGAGTMTLSGASTYTGTTTISGGTLLLGASDRLAASSSLTLAGGTLATGGFGQTLGTLKLNSSSTIDFGSGTSALVFANSSAVAWTGTLSILNYTSGTDTLRIGTSNGGLTTAQLTQISFGGLFAQIDANGFVSPSAIPEPSTYAALAGMCALGVVLWRRRKTASRIRR